MNDKTKLIGIFYIIFGAMGLLGLPMIYVQKQVMIMVFANIGNVGGEAQYVIDLINEMMKILMPALVALIIAHIVFNVLVGICFIKHKAYYTCLITSIFTCLVFPLGTILGVFALMALIDEDIKKLFYTKK
jgi:cytochrome b561